MVENVWLDEEDAVVPQSFVDYHLSGCVSKDKVKEEIDYWETLFKEVWEGERLEAVLEMFRRIKQGLGL